MFKRCLLILLFVFFVFSKVGVAQESQYLPLPKISLIGNMLYQSTSDDQNFDVKEIEMAFQHYLYPSVKADIFMALHKETNGARNFELEEAYVTFIDVFDVMIPNSQIPWGVGALVGKKKLGIGKINPLHPEQWQFVDRPLVIKQFFGEEEGLSAEGGSVSTLLPLAFFSQLEFGYWSAAPHAEETGGGHAHSGIEYKNSLLTARLWNSFSVSDQQELEFGLSYLSGNRLASSVDDQILVSGFDVGYSHELNSVQSVKLNSEYYQAQYGDEGESRETQTGAFLSGTYVLNPYYQAGLRYGVLSRHGGEGAVKNQMTYMLTRQLTETSKFRFQYNTGQNVEDTVSVQFIFGMGPHSHVLQ